MKKIFRSSDNLVSNLPNYNQPKEIVKFFKEIHEKANKNKAFKWITNFQNIQIWI